MMRGAKARTRAVAPLSFARSLNVTARPRSIVRRGTQGARLALSRGVMQDAFRWHQKREKNRNYISFAPTLIECRFFSSADSP